MATLGREADRRRLLPNLLTAALQRALALVEMDRGVSIAEDLNLDVTGAGDETLQVQASVPERSERLGARLRDLGCELRGRRCIADSTPATASRRLDHQRIADGFSCLAGRACILDAPVGARHHWDARARRHLARDGLVAHGPDGFGPRSHEREPGAFHHRGEVRVLRQEAVTGMDGVCAARDGGGDDRLFLQVGFRGVRRPDFRDFVRHPRSEHIPVSGADRLDGADAERLRGAYDADRDFPAVGDKKPPDQHRALRRRGRRAAGQPSPDPHLPRGMSEGAQPRRRPPA